jgi:hypothetical protein
VPTSADQPLHIRFHQQLNHRLRHRSQKITISGFGQEVGQR